MVSANFSNFSGTVEQMHMLVHRAEGSTHVSPVLTGTLFCSG